MNEFIAFIDAQEAEPESVRLTLDSLAQQAHEFQTVILGPEPSGTGRAPDARNPRFAVFLRAGEALYPLASIQLATAFSITNAALISAHRYLRRDGNDPVRVGATPAFPWLFALDQDQLVLPTIRGLWSAFLEALDGCPAEFQLEVPISELSVAPVGTSPEFARALRHLITSARPPDMVGAYEGLRGKHRARIEHLESRNERLARRLSETRYELAFANAALAESQGPLSRGTRRLANAIKRVPGVVQLLKTVRGNSAGNRWRD